MLSLLPQRPRLCTPLASPQRTCPPLLTPTLPLCSLAHVRRLLAAADRLPVEMRIQLGLHARSEPAADWHSKLLALQRCLEAEQACAARQALQPRQPRQLPQQQRPAAAQHSTQHKAPSGQHAAAGARTGDPAHVPVPARRLQHSS